MATAPDQLKLLALDPEDLTVVAAHLQDAVGLIADLAYLPRERRFVALLNRFDWAKAITEDGKTNEACERRRAALRVERVLKAQVQGVDLTHKGEVVSVLTLQFEPEGDPNETPGGTLTLLLAGGGAIRLQVECVELVLEDLGPVWAARAAPDHEIGDRSGDANSK